MTANLTQARATYADLEAASPLLVAEIVRGRLVTHPRPAPRHAFAASRLGIVLGGPFDLGLGGPGGWLILDEPELHLGQDVTVPDIAGWRRERMPEVPTTAYFETPPDWVCEVVSPSTERYDRGEKRDIYAEHGVQHLWLLDPVAKLLETFELRSAPWVLLATYHDVEGQQIAAQPFDAVPFELGKVWR